MDSGSKIDEDDPFLGKLTNRRLSQGKGENIQDRNNLFKSDYDYGLTYE